MAKIVRLGSSTLAKLQSGGGASFNVPSIWNQAAYGSGWPIAPVEAPKDADLPRSIDFPIAVNSSITPRTGYGLMPFASLLEAYQNVTECSTPVSLINRELTAFQAKLIDRDGNEVEDHDYAWMCNMPDRRTPFNVWQTRFLKSAKIYDAPAIYMQRDGNQTTGLHYIDGSTLFIIIDQFGNVPKADLIDDEYIRRELTNESTVYKFMPMTGIQPIQGTPTTIRELVARIAERRAQGKPTPEKIPAYAQIIKGTPFSWWSEDQIWYKPQSMRVNSPYGESFIEQAWSWIMLIVNITAFELGFYRTGNMPEGFVTLPHSQYPTPDKILLAEMMYNQRMSSNPATERMRLRMFPEGTTYTATKKSDFPSMLYTQAWKNILHAIGIPPSEFGDIPGQGLGGKGFKEGAASDLGRNTLNPHREFICSLFNYALDRDGVDDVRFDLQFPLEEIDPSEQRQQVYEGMAHGTYTLNDALAQLGLNAVEGSMLEGKDRRGNMIQLPDPKHIANKHLIVAGSTIYVIEDMDTQNGMAVPTFGAQDEIGAGGTPVDPETVVERDGKEHTSEDFKTLQALIQQAMSTGTTSNTTYSIPSTVTSDKTKTTKVALSKADATHSDGAMVAVFIPDEVAKQLRSIAESLGLPDTAELELPENMHVTLAYLPDSSAAKQASSAILSELQRIAQERKDRTVLACNVQGYGVFNGSDGKKVLYASLDNPDLPFLRERILAALEQLHIDYSREHGFVPHITMAYYPESFELPAGFSVPDIPCNIPTFTLAFGTDRIEVPLAIKKLAKHCGVCEEDDQYFGAPINRETQFTFPNTNHANSVEIVAMAPDELPPIAALWKPEGGELDLLRERIGGAMYPREEAAYLLDRSLGFYLVPVAYATETTDGEHGAVIYYSGEMLPPLAPGQYGSDWIEKAGVFDYIISQQDRGYHHNYGTHPDVSERPVLFDNGLSFPSDPRLFCQSPFYELMVGIPLSENTINAVVMCLGDAATWSDIRGLVGSAAAIHARECAQRLVGKRMIEFEQDYLFDITTDGSVGL